MFAAGIIILAVAALIRVWGAHQHRQGREFQVPLYTFCGMLSPAYSGLIFAVGSTILGILGAVLIGVSKGFLTGIVSFGVFWILPHLW